MLILTRRTGETLILGKDGDVEVTVLNVRGNQVRLGVKAPRDVGVHRKEVYARIMQEGAPENTGKMDDTAAKAVVQEKKIVD